MCGPDHAEGRARQPREGAAAPAQTGRSYRDDLFVGLRFVFSNGLLLSMVAVVAVPNALAGALVTVVPPFTELPALQRARPDRRVGGHGLGRPPGEWLYPQVQEALSAWSRAHRPSHVVYRVVGEQWDPACHDLRDSMGVNSVPFTFHLPDGDDGRQLVRDHGVDVGRLPVAIRHDGIVLHQPSLTEPAASTTVV